MDPLLLDTNCFYRVAGSRPKQDKLRSLLPNIATSPMAVLEIPRVSSKKGDFEKRKLAMEALDYISPTILPETPDDIVTRAFGLPKRDGTGIDYKNIIRTMILAKSYDEAVNGVEDSANGVILKIKPEALHDWKKNISSYFTRAVVSGNKEARQMFLERLKHQATGEDEKKLKKAAKQLSAMTSTHEKALQYAIVGLSVRAGLYTEDQLHDALTHDKMNELAAKACSLYNGLVDSYLKVYLAFQNHFANGQTPEQNAIFDLEFFFHLDAHGAHYTFVTTEDFWITLAKKSILGRVVHLNSIIE